MDGRGFGWMVAVYTSSFKITTVRPEFVGRRIVTIHAVLQEIKYGLRAGCLETEGIISREVRYQTNHGIRRTLDQVQFVVNLGECAEIPVEGFRVELKQNYFFWQPMKCSEGILEQGFSLELTKQPSVTTRQLLELPQVIAEGSESFFLELELTLPSQAKPEALRGEVIFMPPDQLAFLTGKVTGVLCYRSTELILVEHEFALEFSNKLPIVPGDAQAFWKITGAIAGAAWLPKVHGQEWLITIKIDYHWWRLARRALWCETATGNLLSDLWVQTSRVLAKKNWNCLKRFVWSLAERPTDEISLAILNKETRLVKNGLLVSSELQVLIYVVTEENQEACQEFRVLIEELISELNDWQFELGEFFELEIIPKVQDFKWQNEQFELTVDLSYQIQVRRTELVCLIENDCSSVAILVKVAGEQQEFNLLEQQELQLAQFPEQINTVQSKLLEFVGTAQQGWLILQGTIEVLIKYVGTTEEWREEVFRFFFQRSFLWTELSAGAELELESVIQHETYQSTERTLNYQVLIDFRGRFFIERQLKIATSSSMSVASGLNPSRLGYSICLAEIVRLNAGKLRQISWQQATVVELSWERTVDGILLKGVVLVKLEYWNQRGCLCEEQFCQSFQKNLPQIAGEPNWFAWVKQLKLEPVKILPWQKGRCLMELEITLENLGREE